MRLAWIGIAGALGALTRHGLSALIAERSNGGFPWGTFAVNVSGSFVLALLLTAAGERLGLSPDARSALAVGFLGAYTTYSTFAFETVRLAEDGALGLAALNVGASVFAGIAAVAAGLWLGRAM